MSESDSPTPTPTPFQRKTLWAAITGLSLLTIAALICGLVFGMARLFVALEAVLVPPIIAGILAYILHPIVIFVQGFIKKRVLSVALVLATTLTIVAGFAFTIVPPLIEQTGELIEKRTVYYQKAIAASNDLLERPLVQQGIDMLYKKAQAENAAESPPQASSPAIDNPSYKQKLSEVISMHTELIAGKVFTWLSAGSKILSSITTIIVGMIMVPVFLFFFLMESEHISRNWHDILPLRHSHFRDELVGTLQDINNYVISFVRGQMLVSLIDGALLGIALKIMGLPYAITIAAAAAILGIIPYIGNILTLLPALLIAWVTWQDASYVLATACIFICVNQFDGWVVQPRIVGKHVGMHDLTIMFSVLFWSLVVGGVIGALLAVPLTASIKVIFTRYIWPSVANPSQQTVEQIPPKKPKKVSID
ncbi:MAG: AI-2E family transporter [Akkermansia sp.]